MQSNLAGQEFKKPKTIGFYPDGWQCYNDLFTIVVLLLYNIYQRLITYGYNCNELKNIT